MGSGASPGRHDTVRPIWLREPKPGRIKRMSDHQRPAFSPVSRPGLMRRLLDFGRRVRNRLLGRKSTKNPNIYPLY